MGIDMKVAALLLAALFSTGVAASTDQPAIGIIKPNGSNEEAFYTANDHLHTGDRLFLLSAMRRNIACCATIAGKAVRVRDPYSAFVTFNAYGDSESMYAYALAKSNDASLRDGGLLIAVTAAAVSIHRDTYSWTAINGTTYEIDTCLGEEGVNIYLNRTHVSLRRYYVPLGYDVEASNCQDMDP